MTSRRGFILGAASLLVAPAIVRAASLMPIRGLVMDAGLTFSIIDPPVFRFVSVYDLAGRLEAFWDYGVPVHLIQGDTVTLDIDGGRKIPFDAHQLERVVDGKRYVLEPVRYLLKTVMEAPTPD